MTENEPDPAEDPWLTLAEIAEELRVNPATVRLWISRGRLKAMRAGQRKLLVRRSELDRMLTLADPSRAEPAQPRDPGSAPSGLLPPIDGTGRSGEGKHGSGRHPRGDQGDAGGRGRL